MARRAKTLDQIQRMKAKAVRFVRDVLGDPERAEEIEEESPEEYAERKRIRILDNPAIVMLQRRISMAETTREATKAELQDLLDKIEDLADDALDPELSREEVVAKVKEIADLASSEPEDEEEAEGAEEEEVEAED